MKKSLIALFAATAIALPAFANPYLDAGRNEARAEIAKLKVTGRWTGTGWIDVPKMGRMDFRSEETVVERLGGSALVIEGLHRDSKTNAVVHNALGLLSWDAGAKEYKMATALDFGRGGYFPGRLEGNRFTWVIDMPGGVKQRYAIVVDGDRWVETGERSRDGATWEPFFHMELTKVK
jgi:hypothetical protein